MNVDMKYFFIVNIVRQKVVLINPHKGDFLAIEDILFKKNRRYMLCEKKTVNLLSVSMIFSVRCIFHV